MHTGFQAWLLLWSAIAQVMGKPNSCTSAPESTGAQCILRALGRLSGAEYCSSFLSISTSTVPSTSTFTRTLVESTTETTGFAVATGTPPLTETKSRTRTINGTDIRTHTKTIFTSTSTSYIDTSTITYISASTIYTCPSPGNTTISGGHGHTPIGSGVHPPPPFSTSSPTRSNFTFTGHHPRPLATTDPGTTTCSDAAQDKRQASAFTSPYCLKKFARTYGPSAISNACECLAISTPSPVTSTVVVTDPSQTVTSTKTIRVEGTTTVTPTTTSIRHITTTLERTTTTIVKTSTIKTVNATSTLLFTSTSTITTASPTPTQFNVFFTNSTSNSTGPSANFIKAVTAPGGSGFVLTSEAGADTFSLDSAGRLVDVTDGNKYLSKNKDDLYPFQLLRTEAPSKNTPLCSACGGSLHCNYPDTSGNTFALCYGYLALGPKSAFGKDSDGNGQVDCTPIKLQFK